MRRIREAILFCGNKYKLKQKNKYEIKYRIYKNKQKYSRTLQYQAYYVIMTVEEPLEKELIIIRKL